MIKLFPSSTKLIEIGPLSITYYAFLIMSGALLAYYFIMRNAKANKYPKRFFDDLFFYCLLAGIIGARLWFCAFYDFWGYLTHPIRILEIYEGGLAIHGAVVAALIVGFIYAKKHNLSFLRLTDQIMPCVLLAQAIGRWGNFINKEAHGSVVSESFFNGPLHFLKEGMHINGQYYEPTFFYESMLNLLGFVLINFVLRKTTKKRGDLFFAYFMWYGVVRFFIEFKRTDALHVAGSLMIAQVTSIVFLVFGLLGFLGVFKRFYVKRKPVVIFDLDGTLIDSERGIIETYRELFRRHDKVENFDEAKQLEVLGPALRELFPKYFPGQDVEVLVKEYREINDAIFENVNKPMDDAYYVLKSLKDFNYHVGIVSTKTHPVIEKELKLYQLDGFVDDIIGCDDVKVNKPDPEGIFKLLERNNFTHDELVYVGDSATDIKAGKAANAYTVGFYFNPQRRQALDNEHANAYISNLKDLLDILVKDMHFTSDGR